MRRIALPRPDLLPTAAGRGENEGMTDAAPDTADRHLEAALADRRGTLPQRVVRTVLSIVAGLLTNDLEAGPSATDLVIRRRDSGREVIRMSAGTTEEASRLLAHARRDLARLSVTDFVAQWQPAR